MSLLESISNDLRELPEPSLAEVARFVRNMKGGPAPDPEARRLALEATFGCMAGPEGEEFERATREAGGHVDEPEG